MGANLHVSRHGVEINKTFGPRVSLYSRSEGLQVYKASWTPKFGKLSWTLTFKSEAADLRDSTRDSAFEFRVEGRSFYVWVGKEGDVHELPSALDVYEWFQGRIPSRVEPIVKSRFDRILEEDPDPKKPTTPEDIDAALAVFDAKYQEEQAKEKAKADPLGILEDFLKGK